MCCGEADDLGLNPAIVHTRSTYVLCRQLDLSFESCHRPNHSKDTGCLGLALDERKMNIRGKDDCDRHGEDGEDECGPEGKDGGEDGIREL